MNRNLFAFASNRHIAATIALACTACAPGGLSSPEEGWADHDPEEAQALNPDDDPGLDEVTRSVDVSLDKELPKIEGTGFTLIEEVSLPGRKVGFYEADDGLTFEIEVGRQGAVKKHPEEADLRGSALYEFLTHKQAPKRLVDAEMREGVTQQAAPRPVAASLPSSNTKGLCTTQGGCDWDRGSFLAEYCHQTDRYYERIWATGDTWLSTRGTEYQKAGVYTNIGQVRYNAWYQGGTFNRVVFRIWTLVSAGHFVGWRHAGSIRQGDTLTSVEEAEGDRYDHCANWHY